MSQSTVLLEKRGAVALLTLNRPENANVLNIPMARELLDWSFAIQKDPAIRAVVITGAGKHFCFGGDLRGMMAEGGAVDAYLHELASILHAAISQFVRMDAPVIAAVNGTAAGGGIGIVTAADLCICGTSSRFSLAYSGVALTPDCSSSFFLPRIVGHRRAMELILTNRMLGADEALSWGLVNQLVADADVLAEALQLADKLAAGPRRAHGKTKRLLAGASGALESHMALECQMIARQAASAEGQEGIRAFLDKRKPNFS
jgi:2-(1,2-epoxy-1,2-dihydrophenyl)acetyl-CoA isomerase